MASFLDDARLAFASLGTFATDLVTPTLRLGVTGLSRSGKTVFITALVHGLMRGARWPVFEAGAQGRIANVRLADQPDDGVPRFPLEDNIRQLTAGAERRWPEGTRRISEIRLIIDYMSQAGFIRGTNRTLTVDIVDYPGEWLLDLPLLGQSYRHWADRSLAASHTLPRAALAGDFHKALAKLDPNGPPNEAATGAAWRAFADYLAACRDERVSLSMLPPGRFLMPGDMDGSPALTFVPLPDIGPAGEGSLAKQMERRFESYKRLVVMPFFRDHFALIDRQIVLVDALTAINAGPAALSDLEAAMVDILTAFRHGANSFLTSLIARRIDKVLFAATKADHLPATSHDRLEAILARIAGRAIDRAAFAGARVDTLALSALRATREARVNGAGAGMDCIVGTPIAGERLGERRFDGASEAVLFPGDLPEDPDAVFRAGAGGFEPDDYRFLRFRPPADGDWRHIRLDRAAQFLIGDRLT
jgi:predicted YcjX-like family ATPase